MTRPTDRRSDQPSRGASNGGRGRRNSQQLKQALEDLVADGVAGQRLPSERELAATYGVARMTVRAALSRLERRGLIWRLQGAGTYIAEPRFAQPPLLTSFTEDMHDRGMEPGSVLLSQTLDRAGERIGHHLGVAADDQIVVIERVRTGNGEPVAVERAHLASHRFPGLENADVISRSLYVILAEDYGCRLGSCEQRVTSECADARLAGLLGVARHSPVLHIERVTRDVAGSVVEHVSSSYRGDRYELHTEHRRSHDLVSPSLRVVGSRQTWGSLRLAEAVRDTSVTRAVTRGVSNRPDGDEDGWRDQGAMKGRGTDDEGKED
ncbi:MAG: GntR family transcriptional regulator [Nitriliruptoraceae bacterium]